MNGILIVAELADGALRPETLAAHAVAQRVRRGPDEPVAALVVDAALAAASLLALDGIDEIVHVAADASPDAIALAAGALARELQSRLILAGHTVNAVAHGPRIAVELGGGFASGVLDAASDGDGVRVVRDVYGGRLRAELSLAGDAPAVLLVRMPAATLQPPAPATPPVTKRSTPPGERIRSRRLRTERPDAGELDLAGARFVLGIGRGIGERESVELFEGLAAAMGATLGSSRPLVDAGWMPRERQVGQSGTSIAPAVYLAFGISGAAEHLAGIRGAETVIAVNTDPRAPIFATATYGAVADALVVADELARRWS